jgi:hypothetical protein
MLGFKCFKKLQGIFIHLILPSTVIYCNIIVYELMKALWEKQNMYPPLSLNKVSCHIRFHEFLCKWCDPSLFCSLTSKNYVQPNNNTGIVAQRIFMQNNTTFNEINKLKQYNN